MIGLLIGAIFGSKFGGIFGMIFCAGLGLMAEEWVRENLLGLPSYKKRVQIAYFKALFVSIGKLAKVDGVVTSSEINKCELIMRRMNLSNSQRQQAINFFNAGKKDNYNITQVINSFRKVSIRSYTIKQMFLEMLVEVATSEGRINPQEWSLLVNISQLLRFPQQLLVALVKMHGFNVEGNQAYQRSKSKSNSSSSSNHRKKWSPPRQQKVNSYQVLGVSSTDSKKVIRRAYKKLMSQHHPDKLIAKGLPPEMVEIAKKKTQNIQVAWEDIKQKRGF